MTTSISSTPRIAPTIPPAPSPAENFAQTNFPGTYSRNPNVLPPEQRTLPTAPQPVVTQPSSPIPTPEGRSTLHRLEAESE